MIEALILFGMLCLATAVVCILDDSDPVYEVWDESQTNE